LILIATIDGGAHVYNPTDPGLSLGRGKSICQDSEKTVKRSKTAKKL